MNKFKSFFKRNKYGAKRTNGFSSKLEAAVYEILKQKEASGEIKNIRCQHAIILQDGKRDVRVSWKCDYSYEETSTGDLVYVESKGVRTTDFVIKLKLYKARIENKLIIYGGNYRYPKVVEVIEKMENRK